MLWVPAARVDVLKLAVPVLSRVFVPRMMLSSRNVIVSVGGSGDCGVFITLAVKVMVCPLTAGFALDASVVVVVAWAG